MNYPAHHAVALFVVSLFLFVPMPVQTDHIPNSANNTPAITQGNPLLRQWAGPYGGIPPFDEIEVTHFEPAFEAAMKERLTEIEKIANADQAPTFLNTLAALERAGKTMDRVQRIYSIWSGNLSTPSFQAVQREMAPRLAAFADKIIQNEKLFSKIESVHSGRVVNVPVADPSQ